MHIIPQNDNELHSQFEEMGISANGSTARYKVTKVVAFTLVEMSIVLIIIGLIVAGIAKGQSMIHSAKVMSVVSFIEQKKVAVRTFEMKYDALPGDMNNATDYWPSGVGNNGTVTNGDGDFKIEWSNEAHMVWKHLFLAGMTDENLTGIRGSQAGKAGVNVPESQLEGVGVSIYFMNTVATSSNMTKHRFLLGKFNPANSGASNNGAALYPSDAQSIDKKMDDGLPQSGKVRSLNAVNTNSSVVSCLTGTAYLLSVDELRCAMLFDFD